MSSPPADFRGQHRRLTAATVLPLATRSLTDMSHGYDVLGSLERWPGWHLAQAALVVAAGALSPQLVLAGRDRGRARASAALPAAPGDMTPATAVRLHTGVVPAQGGVFGPTTRPRPPRAR